MDNAILVFNAGSSSIKFAIFVLGDEKNVLGRVCRGQIAGIGHNAKFTVQSTGHLASNELLEVDDIVSIQNHEDALQALLDWLGNQLRALQIVAVGHRVVHGGIFFSSPVVVDAAVEAQLEELIPLAPLHQPHNLAAIRALKQIRPKLVQVACFDTSFHHTMPPVAQSIALPRTLTKEGVRRYGFHGLSYEYIASVLPDYLGVAAEGRVIVAHLGHGVSMCAMEKRKSIATTMSFTPLDGLPMGTRCGAIDPAIILYLMREKHMNIDTVSDLLHYQSGLLGLSGISGDMHELLESDSLHATEAIDLFVYRVALELGSLAAALGGVDAVVFTGGIGEHATAIRTRICQDASWLGVHLDESANIAGGPRISAVNSAVSTWVIATDEELIIARHTQALLEGVQ